MNTGLLSSFVASKSDEFHGGPYVEKLEEISKNIFKVKNNNFFKFKYFRFNRSYWSNKYQSW